MIDGITGTAKKRYNIAWGKWFTIGGILCALVVYIVSAWVGLLPQLAINRIGTDKEYGPSYTMTQGFYNLKFYTSTPAYNDISLSVAGIVMIVFINLSILLPLIGYAKASNRLFYKSQNGIFVWFLAFLVVMGILMAAAVFVACPYKTRDESDIWRSDFFSASKVTWNGSQITGLNLHGNSNYWILFGLTLAGGASIIVFGWYTSRKIFFRNSEFRTHAHAKKKD